MAKHTTSALILFAGLLGAAPVVHAVEEQRPERPQEVRVPGIDVMLKGGWQLLFHDGCRFAVPVSWHQDADGLVLAPDGSNLSIRMLRITSWSAHKAQIRAAYVHLNVVHDDSDRRFWFEIGNASRIQHYIAVAAGSTVCAGLLEIHSNTTPDPADTTRRIADSIGPAPEK